MEQGTRTGRGVAALACLVSVVSGLVGCGGADGAGAPAQAAGPVGVPAGSQAAAQSAGQLAQGALHVAAPSSEAVRPAPVPAPSPEVAVSGDGSSLLALSQSDRFDAVRLAQQGSFGPTEALIQQVRTQRAAGWVATQMALDVSRYTSGRGDAIHRNTSFTDFCDLPANAGPHCWRDWFSTEPLLWDFYRNAVSQPDQLRQRVAFALQQIVVVSNLEVFGTYGFRNYHNMLLAGAFGTWRELLRGVTLSPVMGEYLNQVNNDPDAPNENYARELLELFSVGPCRLRADGRLLGDICQPTYDNTTVREYAFALTGWTYPTGGATAWGCWPAGTNCPYFGGEMVAAPVLRNSEPRSLLSGVSVPAGASAAQALDAVLDSLMAHPNTAPFVSRQLIQHLVSSNPSPRYIERVATVFEAGQFSAEGQSFGDGQRGNLAAVVAAILLDNEAQGHHRNVLTTGGQLRQPALLFTGALRALGGSTDGAPLGWWWGETLRQHVFRPPSVFNFYSPDYPVPGTGLVGPQFGIHNANAALNRLNYLTYLLDWGGSDPHPSVPGATGTSVNLAPWLPLADDPDQLILNFSLVTLGRPLQGQALDRVRTAVSWWTAANSGTDWRRRRVATAVWLVLASPDYQVQR